MKIGIKVKALREFRNFTQAHVAESIGMGQSSYSKLEKGTVDIPYGKLEEIAAVLLVDVVDIINFNEGMIFKTHDMKKANGVSPNERKLYTEYIEELKNQVEFLKNTVDRLLGKKQITKKTKTT